ncbi:hypothetical protein A2U01_0103737, partial [Trifolium medium]|nr:hypothetical protein [Trifolium medium]
MDAEASSSTIPIAQNQVNLPMNSSMDVLSPYFMHPNENP